MVLHVYKFSLLSSLSVFYLFDKNKLKLLLQSVLNSRIQILVLSVVILTHLSHIGVSRSSWMSIIQLLIQLSIHFVVNIPDNWNYEYWNRKLNTTRNTICKHGKWPLNFRHFYSNNPQFFQGKKVPDPLQPFSVVFTILSSKNTVVSIKLSCSVESFMTKLFLSNYQNLQ